MIRTCVTLTPEQKEFLDKNAISLSKMLHSVLNKRIQEATTKAKDTSNGEA
ncbi:hypothetical protein NUZ5A_51068 [Candidatus Nitrosotenuis uzonensis]|uniref:Uncharacterized protein n=1 Tax=Candidatus Nitrosotenuis uzonensis TaxID=1407055 RepID=A0A812F3V3_9ARCH|nr:hypothetical protein NUZ5A_51068 [Candidatus Nitrosotenuis uzonensis]